MSYGMRATATSLLILVTWQTSADFSLLNKPDLDVTSEHAISTESYNSFTDEPEADLIDDSESSLIQNLDTEAYTDDPQDDDQRESKV